MSAETRVAVGARVSTALAGVTAPGPSNPIDFGSAMSSFTMQSVVTGAPTAVSLVLEGSLDGANWATLATSTSVTGDQQYATGKPQRFVRARLATLTGGTSPTVTAFIAGTPGS